MKLFLVLISFVISTQAFGDARPFPHPDTKIYTSTYFGQAAQEKYSTMAGEENQEHSGFYKVERSADQLEQTVCHRFSRSSEFTCTYQRSLNGKLLPVYVPREHSVHD